MILEIHKKIVLDEIQNPFAVQIPIEEFELLEEIIEDYGLSKLIVDYHFEDFHVFSDSKTSQRFISVPSSVLNARTSKRPNNSHLPYIPSASNRNLLKYSSMGSITTYSFTPAFSESLFFSCKSFKAVSEERTLT